MLSKQTRCVIHIYLNMKIIFERSFERISEILSRCRSKAVRHRMLDVKSKINFDICLFL